MSKLLTAIERRVVFEKPGSCLQGMCPFCRKSSFVYLKPKDAYYCFSCRRAGDSYEAFDLLEVIKEVVVDLEEVGEDLEGTCPFCFKDEFRYLSFEDAYYCFSCHQGGSEKHHLELVTFRSLLKASPSLEGIIKKFKERISLAGNSDLKRSLRYQLLAILTSRGLKL